MIVLDSVRVLCVCVGFLLFWRMLIRSAVIFLHTSRSVWGRREMAVSASRARFWIQSLGLSFRLYLGPFCNRAISGSENGMSVMFTTLR